MTYLRKLPSGTRKPDAAVVAADLRRAAEATGNPDTIAAVEAAIQATTKGTTS